MNEWMSLVDTERNKIDEETNEGTAEDTVHYEQMKY